MCRFSQLERIHQVVSSPYLVSLQIKTAYKQVALPAFPAKVLFFNKDPHVVKQRQQDIESKPAQIVTSLSGPRVPERANRAR